MSELLAKLEEVADILKITRRSKSWPKAPNSLGRRINEIKTNLREIGIVIDNTGSRDSKTKVKTIEIRKVSLLPLPSLPDKNRAQIAGDIGNDIDEKGTTTSFGDKISLPKILKNQAQNDTGNDSDDGNDILHTLQESEPKQITCYSCYYCDYTIYNKDHYERHVILRHSHSPAYPNRAEIEKRGLKPQGKEWEK
jgi:hypothetical protein